MPAIQFPAEEALKRRRRLVDEGSAADLAKAFRVVERHGLVIVEDVALAVVGRSAAERLVPEGGTLFDRQSVVCVDEGLTDGERTALRLEVDRDEGSRHGTRAWEEERTTLFDETRELVADGIHPQVRTRVAYPHRHCRGTVLAWDGEGA